jgi:hypothetical protein
MKKINEVTGIFLMGIFLMSCNFIREASSNSSSPQNFKNIDVPGQSLPGDWRPFNDDSPWNTPVISSAAVHPMSQSIINRMSAAVGHIRFGNSYLIPLWVVNSDQMNFYPAKAAYPFDIWDYNNDFTTDIGVPVSTSLWGEQTEDGHIILIDTVFNFSWEMSRFKGIENEIINCSTFNVWDLSGTGVGDPNEGKRWKSRGGRAAGFPNIAGLIRPEEIQSGEIRHALAFTFASVKKNDFYFPACRTDGFLDDADAPAEGMLFQLNPQLTDSDFDNWGLSEGAKVVARTLQKYGMYLCDRGGDMTLQLQLLDRNSEENRKKWDKISPGLYSSIVKIPTNQFRLINTQEPVSGGAMDVVTTPLIIPPCGTFKKQAKITMVVNQEWPDAVIRYTLDGINPTKSSLLYTKPFTLRSSKTIKARAFDERGKNSHTMRASIIIN